MGREKDRDLRRRRQRQQKLRKFKKRLTQATRQEERKFLVKKIRRISLNPKQDIPEKLHDLL
jgi:hypothetical protein